MLDQNSVIRKLQATLEVPDGEVEHRAWLTMESSVGFLDANAGTDSIVLFLSAGHMFVVSAIVPTASVSSPDFTDLMNWDTDPWSSWSLWTSAEGGRVENPLASDASKTIAEGEQLVFLRSFEGVPERSGYVEILQKFTHLMGLHFMPERDAWCRLDKHGDLEDVVRVVQLDPTEASPRSGRVVLCDRDTLARYAAMTDGTLVRVFDYTYTGPNFGGWTSQEQTEKTLGPNIRYRYTRNSGPACYLRGAEVVPLDAPSKQEIAESWHRDEDKQYASFIAQDWKNNRIVEVSCGPDALANYFTESEKPFEITPAFFRPEVLLKYKGDREKYRLADRSVSCRGAWELRTFDINTEGQVHTYLRYLRDLPFEEQLHWKQYNEQPRAPISARALKTDIEGNWSDEYDPLPSLKYKLRKLADQNARWWKLRAADLPERAYYPVTTSPDEWADEILNLDQLLVEGFVEKALRARCGVTDLRTRSLGLLEACLMQYGFDEERAREILKPLRELHDLRTKVKGHASGAEAKTIRQSAIRKFGSLAQHYRDLVTRCDESLDALTTALSAVEPT
jgi:hypothetical protein